jgi:cytochrome c
LKLENALKNWGPFLSVACLSLLMAACNNKEEKAPVNAVVTSSAPAVPIATNNAPTETSIVPDGEMPLSARKNNCTACHGLNKKIVGPSWIDVSKKYKGDTTAQAKLSEKIKKGGAGIWGTTPMPANPKVSDEDLKELLNFILGLSH